MSHRFGVRGSGGRLPCAVLAATLLVACGSSPEPTYFALLAHPGSKVQWPPHVVKLRRIGLAGYLDRGDIVDGVSDYKLHVASGNRWGEPLGDMLGRVLAEDLAALLPTSTVFSEAGTISADADTIVEVDIQRFDTGPDGVVQLVAQVAIERPQTPGVSRSLVFAAPRRGSAVSSLVATMSDLLGQLAEAIAALLRAT